MNNPLAPGATQAPNSMIAPNVKTTHINDVPGVIRGLNLSQDQLAREASATSYGAKEIGALARNPDVTPKDVINCMGQAVADGQITPTNAVKFLSEMPQSDDGLKSWLNQKYATLLAISVHAKAIAMGAQPQSPGPSPMQAPPPTMNPNAAPAPGNAPEPVTTGV